MSSKFKGKKLDYDFINEFIENCINCNISSSEDIVALAEDQIKKIDAKLLKINSLKEKRNKLLGVIESFEK